MNWVFKYSSLCFVFKKVKHITIYNEQICPVSFASIISAITVLGRKVFHTFRLAILLKLFSPVGESLLVSGGNSPFIAVIVKHKSMQMYCCKFAP
jgi:hypothetical protein